MSDDDAYHRRVMELVMRMMQQPDPIAGVPIVSSANENNIFDPCDALRRLGIMEPFATTPKRSWQPRSECEVEVLEYAFRPSWAMGGPGRIFRHPGEPTYTDLLRVLCNDAWFLGSSLRSMRIDPSVGPAEKKFIDDLVARGFGSWSDENGIVLNRDSGGWNEISNDYWNARLELATKLGSEAALFPSRA
jgi:hypothetical protein